jgi:hypothetical protein
MQQDVHEVREAIGAERQARLARHEREAASPSAPPPLDMTEDEAVAYAMLLSSEEADARAIAASLEEDMALLDLDYDEDATAVFSPARRASSRASTASSAASAISEAEDEDDVDSFVGSPARSIASNRYYPLSPRLMPTAPPPDLADDAAWPSPSSRSRSPLLSPTARSPLLSPVLGPKRYSDVASATSHAPPGLHYDLPSPSPSPARRRPPAAAGADGEDADLQFAIELSLAEARSRLDAEE